MTDHVRRWLSDDLFVLNAVLVVLVVTCFAVALTSCLWHHLHHDTDDHPSILSAALASFHFSVARSVQVTTQQQSLSVATHITEQKDRKSTRSKERRRRTKVPLRDLFKGGKKSKALLKPIKDSESSPDTLSNSSTPQNDTASSTSRSQSPASELLDMDHVAPRLALESDDGNATGMDNTSDAVASAIDISDHGSPNAASQTGSIYTPLPPDPITATDAEVNSSSASTTLVHASEDTPSSPSSPTACADVHTPQSRDSQATYTSGSCANLVRARTKLRLSRMDPGAKSLLLSSTSSPLPDSVASPIHTVLPCPSSSLIRSTYSTDDAGPSTPTNSRGSTPPPQSLSTPEVPDQTEPGTLPPDQYTVTTHIQLASMRTALEAARLREEQLRIEAEQASKERDELRWGWNEDASAWKRREAELQAQIHHLMQQFQAYAVAASYQAPSAFPSPTSPHVHASPRLQHHPLVSFPVPPPIQAQNSASAPAHVQALLASAPMLTSHPPGFTAPSGGVYMSPLLWSGLGLCAPNRDARHGGGRTPDSSASGSSSKGQQRRQCAENATSTSDDSSPLGDWDGMEVCSEDDDTWEEEEDVFRNNVLADAILKRPESIRGLSRVGKRSDGWSPRHGGGVGERIETLKDPALDKPGFVAHLVDVPAIRH